MVALRRAKLLDTAAVALLLLLLSAVHYGLLKSRRTQRFVNMNQQRAYVGLLIASWPALALGAVPMLGFWWSGRAADRAHYSNAKPRHLTGVMVAASLVALGCLLMAIAQIIWVVDFGFSRFHLVTVLGLVSFVLLTWIAVQVALLVREASVVRRHIIEHPEDGALPTPSDFGYTVGGSAQKGNSPFP